MSLPNRALDTLIERTGRQAAGRERYRPSVETMKEANVDRDMPKWNWGTDVLSGRMGNDEIIDQLKAISTDDLVGLMSFLAKSIKAISGGEVVLKMKQAGEKKEGVSLDADEVDDLLFFLHSTFEMIGKTEEENEKLKGMLKEQEG